MHEPPDSSPITQRNGGGDEPQTASLSGASSDSIIIDDFPSGNEIFQRFVRHEQLGRGGFGSVYRAYDRHLDRFVAIKVPHINRIDRDRVQKRVAREATATARLRHPNIVTLFDFIQLDDHSLLVNELIEGETLTRLIGRHPGGCDFRLSAAITLRIAQAAQHAHDQSVMHRDIKPSNIMLDETSADGELPFCPRLTDFGLATILRDGELDDHSHVFTETVGTWHYTPPEVINNKNDGHSPACDIYSLGVVLYELITGTRPFQAATLVDLFPKVCNGDFLPPRSIRSDVPRDLEAICLRCMARNPSTRYPTAASLADDLTRFLAGEVVLARMPGRSERFFRWMRRNPTPAAITAVSAIAIVVVFMVIATTNRKLFKLNSQLESMNTELQAALSTTRKTLYEYEQSNYATDLANASTAIEQSQLRNARTLLSRYDDAHPLSHHRDIEWDHNRFLIAKSPITIWEDDLPLYCLCEVDNHYCVAGAASEITIIDRNTGKTVRSLATWQKEINSLVYDKHHNLIWSSGDDGSIHAYDFQTLKQIYNIQAFEAERAYDLALFPDLSRIACLSSHGSIVLLDTTTSNRITLLEKAEDEATSIAKIDSHRIAVGHLQGLLRFYNVSTGEMEQEIQLEGNTSLTPISKDPTRPWLWILGGNVLRIFDLETMDTRLSYKTSDETLCIAHNPVDQSAVVALRGGVFHRYLVTEDLDMKEIDQWVNDGQRVYNIAFDTQSNIPVTVSASGDVLAWQSRQLSRTNFTIAPAPPTVDGLYSFQIIPGTPTGQWPILVANHAGTLMRLDTRTTSRTDTGLQSNIYHKFVVIDDHRLVFADDSSIHRIFDQRSNAISDLSIPCVAGQSLRLKGTWFADTDFASNLIRLIDFQKPNQTIELPSQNPGCAAIALRTRQLFWNDGNSVMMRSFELGSPSTKLETFSRNPWHLQLSTDETLLAIGLGDREVHLWDWRTRKAAGPVMMHQGRVLAVAFSPGGRSILTVDDSATLRFWNLTTGQQVSQTHLGLSPGTFINQVQFTSDCSFVVILHDSKSITTVQVR